ncbi:MAG: glutaredoxin family protein [Dehalococcoidia bacterium]|nr:Glutaredoxin 3 [Chloroflexota bacterium]MBT9159334.1 Glutaredoxin 3 [Chloroflexota bacterium]MBT9161524.1 Glutaredoxin 3 [Chloroflexota bacterium]
MGAEKAVRIYSTPTCPWCKKAKSFLDKNGIPYQDLNVAVDKVARDEMIKKSGQMGVPVLEIDGDIVIGFNQEQLKEKLGL